MKKLFLGLLCSGLVLGLATGCGISSSSDDSKKYDINIDADENIEVKTYVDYDKDYLIVYMTNNNDYNIGSFDVEATYYDKNGNVIGDDSTTQLDFMSKGNYVVTMDLPHDDDYNNYVPEKIELLVKEDEEYKEYVDEIPVYNDKISTSYAKSTEEIEISIKNNSSYDLHTIELAVIFIKNNKPIYVEGLNGSLEIGESDTQSIDIPEDYEASENSDKDVLIDFDSIEIVVNRASAN